MLIAINYHYVRPAYDHPHEGIYGITPAQLRAQLRVLAEVGTFVSPQDMFAAVRGERDLPERALLVTFDDGFREQVEHALPVLDELSVPALFYVNSDPIERGVICPHHKVHLLRAFTPPAVFLADLSARALAHGVDLASATATSGESGTQYRYDDPVISKIKYALNLGIERVKRDRIVGELFEARFPGAEREMAAALYMDRDQLRGLASRGWLGNHAHEHLPLGLLPLDEARFHLRRGRELLEAWTGVRVDTFSYPFGSRSATSAAVGALAMDEGYAFGFTMERAKNVDLSEPVHLARMDTNDVPGGKSCAHTGPGFFDQTPARSWYGARIR